MTKWIFTGLFVLISIPNFEFSFNDQGPSIGDWVVYPVLFATFVLASLTFVFWLKFYRKTKKKIGIIFCLLPFILIAIQLIIYLRTQEKINKDYFLLAENPNEHSRQFRYYFRNDSTLKTNGIFFWSEGNVYQNFKMKGDTIFLDTIFDYTGIQSRIYLKSTKIESNSDTIELLIPLDKNLIVIDSFTKFIVDFDKH